MLPGLTSNVDRTHSFSEPTTNTPNLVTHASHRGDSHGYSGSQLISKFEIRILKSSTHLDTDSFIVTVRQPRMRHPSWLRRRSTRRALRTLSHYSSVVQPNTPVKSSTPLSGFPYNNRDELCPKHRLLLLPSPTANPYKFHLADVGTSDDHNQTSDCLPVVPTSYKDDVCALAPPTTAQGFLSALLQDQTYSHPAGEPRCVSTH